MNAKMLALAAGLSLATLAATGIARAAQNDADPRGTILFWLLDRNGDGVIGADEMAAFKGVVFDALDTDHDGHLTKDEVTALATQARGKLADRLGQIIRNGPGEMMGRRQAMMGRLGLDRPGGVSKADFVAGDLPLFGRLDQNGDGTITRDEFMAAGAGLGGRR
jgi:hypothetical protein